MAGVLYRWADSLHNLVMSAPSHNANRDHDDEYGVPAALFGQLPVWFFPVVGRVVVVSSLLEDKARVLSETLGGHPQDSLTMESPSKMKRLAVRAAVQIDKSNSGDGIDSISERVTEFFDQVVDLLERRNSIVHAIWPAQTSEEQFGWRPRRLGKDHQTRVTRDNSLEAMTDLVRAEAALILGWSSLHGAATHARIRSMERG